jgi:alpha-glucan phosphorylase-like protein
LTKHLGDWRNDPRAWSKIWDVSDEDLWAFRCMLRKRLIEFAGRRVAAQTLHEAPKLDPEALTIGFARRFATYKRAPLIFHDLERATRLFSRIERPVQIIFAGKAHPADDHGKWFIEQIYQVSKRPEINGKVIYLEGYDMGVGRRLVSGADIWLNNPRRPYEASGTSGMKIAAHGGMNLSILDGWWPEGYNGRNGWAIGNNGSSAYEDPQVQDPEDAELLYQVLENEVIPTFYNRDENGLPTEWLNRMREAMSTLPFQFSSRRMIREYMDRYHVEPPVPAVGV